jgi:hypothetical protein
MTRPIGTGYLPLMTESGRSASPREIAELHPAWVRFIQYCRELVHGEIEGLKVQDGLPMIAEVTKKKVKFT